MDQPGDSHERLELSGSSFSLSTIRQSSATDSALIFRIMLLRWTFTVPSESLMSGDVGTVAVAKFDGNHTYRSVLPFLQPLGRPGLRAR
jgi:hypothetical protein